MPEGRASTQCQYPTGKKGSHMLRAFFQELVNAHFIELSRMRRELRNK